MMLFASTEVTEELHEALLDFEETAPEITLWRTAFLDTLSRVPRDQRREFCAILPELLGDDPERQAAAYQTLSGMLMDAYGRPLPLNNLRTCGGEE